jgi:trk system potassium uptake protein TrkH
MDQIIFEAISALGTVGLSTGITGDLTNIGKIIVILLMFAGRVGPLSLGTTLFGQREEEQQKSEAESEEDDLAIE